MVWILDCSRYGCSKYRNNTRHVYFCWNSNRNQLAMGEIHTMIELFMGLASLVLVALAIFIGILKFTDKEK